MSVTYDPALSTNVDWVRFLIGDVVINPISRAQLTDEEISAVIAEQLVAGDAVKYAAAAQFLEHLLTRYAALGAGQKHKMVHALSITWGVEEFAKNALEDRISYLKKMAARRSTRSRGSFVRSMSPGPFRSPR
jgi:hypothetical protein